MFSMLQYDIPTGNPTPNPSPVLRRLAIRTSYSVWVVQNDRIPWNLLNAWTAAGVRWHLVAFDASAAEQVLGMCETALALEIHRIEAAAQRSVENAGAKLDDPEGDDHEDYDLHDRRVRQAVQRAERSIADARLAATAFGLRLSGHLDCAEITVRNLQSAAHRRAALYGLLTERVAGTMLEAAAVASDVPAEVLADYVEDQTGEDMSLVHGAFR